MVKSDHTSDKRTQKASSGLYSCWASCHPFRQWKSQRKRLMQVLCLAQSHKPHEDLHCICLNLKLSAVITESRSGTDLVSHRVVLPDIASSLYTECGKGSCGVTVVPGGEWGTAQAVHCPGCPTSHWHSRETAERHRPEDHLWPVDVHCSVLVVTGHGVAMSIFWKILSYTCFLLLPLRVFFSLILFL